MRTFLLALAVLPALAFLLVLPSVACAEEYYVDATQGLDSNDGLSPSSAWQTIGEVNSRSFHPGDSILFKSGEVWNEQLIIPSSGSHDNHIIFGSYGTGNKPVINMVDFPEDSCIEIRDKEFITIENLELIGGYRGIYIAPTILTGLISLSGLEIHHSTENGIRVNERGNIDIDNCKIYSCGANGISVYTVTYIWNEFTTNNTKVENCEIFDNYHSGMHLKGHNHQISNNLMYRNGQIGPVHPFRHNIYLVGDNAIVEYNQLLDSPGSCGFRYEGANLTFRYNFVKGNKMHGVTLGSDYPVNFQDNKIYYNIISVTHHNDSPYSTVGAVYVNEREGWFDGVDIYNNVLIGTNEGATGVLLYGCSNVKLKNNIIKTVSSSIHLNTACDNGLESNYNTFLSDIEDSFYSETAGGSGDFSEWQTYVGQDHDSIYADPLFVDEVNNDFHLQSASPVIDAGVNIGLTQDFEGNPVPQGDAPDIGAYEYIGQTVCGNGVCEPGEDLLACPDDCEGGYKSIHYGIDLRILDLNEVTRVQIDFINSHHDYVRTVFESADIRSAIQGPDLMLYRLINGIMEGHQSFDYDHIYANENMFLHSPDSTHENNRILTPFTAWLTNGYDKVDPDDPDAMNHWINHYAVRSAEDVNQYDYDGLFIDSPTYTLSTFWTGGLTTLEEEYSHETYTQARYDAIEYVKSLLPDKIVIANGLHGGSVAEPSLGLVDGGMWELFLFQAHAANDEPSEYWGKDKFIEVIELVERHKDSKTMRLISKYDDLVNNIQARVFIISSYLLVSNENVTITMVPLPEEEFYFDDNRITFPPEFALNMGTESGNYYTEGNLYRRDFQYGFVLVNPDETQSYTYTLDKTYLNVTPQGLGFFHTDGTFGGGSLVYTPISGQLTLPPMSGMILIDAGGTACGNGFCEAGETCLSCPEDCECHRADTDPPFGYIDTEELVAFIDSWKYNSDEYPMWEMMEAVVLYYNP